MNHITSMIGPDVHARNIKDCTFNPHAGEIDRKSFAYDPPTVTDWIPSVIRLAQGRL